MKNTTLTYIQEAEIKIRRHKVCDSKVYKYITNPNDIAAIAKGLIGSNFTEVFTVFVTNAKNKIIGFNHISMGSVNATHLNMSEVFRYPIIAGASGMILCHNHPSGEVEPSPDDVEITKKINKYADDFGITLLDHIIVSEDKYFSMLDSGINFK